MQIIFYTEAYRAQQYLPTRPRPYINKYQSLLDSKGDLIGISRQTVDPIGRPAMLGAYAQIVILFIIV